MRTAFGDTKSIGAEHVVDMKVLPHTGQAAHRVLKARGVNGQHRAINGARGCAANNGEWIGRTGRQHIRNRFEYPDLVRSARTTTSEDQTDHGLL